ncbi:MAG: family 78 glycoside hydrolase catalytic domain, partial [Anaerolineae bacterium]|nr:family 78 glycoside hydrolase catalytic domain [Anaerolineae bacterium]
MSQPRLYWYLTSTVRGAAQTGYQILVASSQAALSRDEADMWDSGYVESDQSTHIAYQGRRLQSGDCCFWKVRVWDADNHPSDYTKPASWQMGILSEEDWHACWIGINPDPEPDMQITPGVYLRKTFAVTKPVKQAVLYATAKGVYIPSLNGKRIGTAELAPGWTDYKQRIQVQTYDVTQDIQEENAVGIVLADGWYSGYLGFNGVKNYYGKVPRALLQLDIRYEDGTRDFIVTDRTWLAHLGPLVFSDVQMGEKYDARREMPGWDTASFDDGDWQSVTCEERTCSLQLVGQPNQPIRVTEDIHPVSVDEHSPGVFIFDMGQNFAGRVTLRVSGPAGAQVRLRYGEMLEPDGSLHTANLRSAKATDFYILKGTRVEVYEPVFTYHGFRYVEITGFPGSPDLDTITGRVMHNDMPYTGSFSCSHELVNKLWRNILWGQRSNFVSIPTDCPQRDERLGWSGDAQIFIRTASFNMDVSAFFTKWLDDMVDAQAPDGAFTDIIPQIKGMPPGAPAWGDAGIIIPWTMYRVYGDTRLIQKHYAAMTRWMDYIAEVNPLYLRTRRLNNNYHDWVALERGSSPEQISTAYWAKIARMMAEMSQAVDRVAEAEYYAGLYEEIKTIYNIAYIGPVGNIETGTQTAYVLALDNDLVPDHLRSTAAAKLVENLNSLDNTGHLGTGFLGTPPLCFVLAQTGHLDTAYQLLNMETYPSWLYMILNGATTMWERWDAYTIEQGIHDPGMNSFNHYAYGAIAEWLYRVVGGIDTAAPGYKHIVLQPQPGGGYTHAAATYQSLHGEIRSSWQSTEQGTRYTFT